MVLQHVFLFKSFVTAGLCAIAPDHANIVNVLAMLSKIRRVLCGVPAAVHRITGIKLYDL